MEAKDTVIEGDRILIYNEIVKCANVARALEKLEEPMSSLISSISSGVGEIMRMHETQAKISFKAGREEGYERGWNDAKKYDRKQRT